MSKKMKSYRLSQETLELLAEMKDENTTETEIIEMAIKDFYDKKITFLDRIRKIWFDLGLELISIFLITLIAVLIGNYLYALIQKII